MANPRYNTQTTNRRGAMNGGRVKKVRGGMMMRKRPMMNKGGRTKKMTEAQKEAAKKTGKIVEKAISFGFPFTKNPELFKKGAKKGVKRLESLMKKISKDPSPDPERREQVKKLRERFKREMVITPEIKKFMKDKKLKAKELPLKPGMKFKDFKPTRPAGTKNPELFKELPLKPGMKGFPKNFKPIKEKK